MDSIKEDLQTRADEIMEFLSLIKFIDESEQITNEQGTRHNIKDSLKNTLKGKVFLLLYNLIESTMKESISHIHEKLEGLEISFNQLRVEFRKEILKRTKSEKIGLQNLFEQTATDISKQLLKATFRKKAVFSGNIDHKEICGQAKIYGFETSTNYNQTKHGQNLETIKDKRNDLAHGNSSFSEIGRNYTYQQLMAFSEEVINYLEGITTHIANCLNQQDYLAP